MVTIEERRKARQATFKAKFVASGKKKATSLSKTAERTAQRRGRGFDPLETVILQATQPPPPPPPPKPKTICDVLGTVKRKRGQTVARGVTMVCGGIPIQFNSQANNTTRQFFGAGIRDNQNKLRAAGLGSSIPKSPAEISGAFRRRKILRRKQKSCGRNIACIQSFSSQIDAIEKEFRI